MNFEADVRADEKIILDEIEELGRLSKEEEDLLYTIALRQDELGRKPTNMLLSKLMSDDVYKNMLEREYITYEVFDNLGNSDRKIASIYVTLKGMRYCVLLADELSAQLDYNPAGVRRDEWVKPI